MRCEVSLVTVVFPKFQNHPVIGLSEVEASVKFTVVFGQISIGSQVKFELGAMVTTIVS